MSKPAPSLDQLLDLSQVRQTPRLVCPGCGKARRGRYCNDGQPMRRTQPASEEEAQAISMAYPPRARHVRRRGGARKSAFLLALAASLGMR